MKSTYQIELANKIQGGKSVGTFFVVTQRPIGRSGIIVSFDSQEEAEAWINKAEAAIAKAEGRKGAAAMSESKHTPGPWENHKDVITGPDGKAIADIVARDDLTYSSARARLDANAARIVACVNAMEGIDDVAAARALLDDPRTAAATDMLEALKKIIRENPTGNGFPGFTEALVAIAKAERWKS